MYLYFKPDSTEQIVELTGTAIIPEESIDEMVSEAVENAWPFDVEVEEEFNSWNNELQVTATASPTISIDDIVMDADYDCDNWEVLEILSIESIREKGFREYEARITVKARKL